MPTSKVELLARFLVREGGLEREHEFERRVLGLVLDTIPSGDARPMSVGEESDQAAVTGPDLGRVPLRMSLPEDLAAFWCDLELVHADAGSPSGSFVAFLVAAALSSWRGMGRVGAYHHVYLRDRYRCQSPVCRSRHVTPHHIVFRSRGGGEDPSNLVALCARCHLDVVHGGHLEVSGLAPHGLTWRSRGFVAQAGP